MNILITGATKGIGKAIANNLDGTLFAAARNEELLKQYKNYCICDLSTKEGSEKLGNYIKKNNIDILINNAGCYTYSDIEKITYDDLENIIHTNLIAPIHLISKAVPYMKEKKWGRIINIGSISGVMGEACASTYSASKAGLIGLTKALALELAQYNITINTINPGWVDTDMGNASSEEGNWNKKEIIDCIPQKRFVKPEEIAGMIKYLISEDAKGVTGQSINLCAGLSVGY